jgi:hypothetical protein
MSSHDLQTLHRHLSAATAIVFTISWVESDFGGTKPSQKNALNQQSSGLGTVTPTWLEFLKGTSKNRRFPPPRKSDSRFSYSERGRLAWDSLASSI